MIIDDHDSPGTTVHTTAVAEKLGALRGHLRGDVDKVIGAAAAVASQAR